MDIYVFVDGGCVESVRDGNGNMIEHTVIDYDCEENGDCPVCGHFQEPDVPCAGCGYESGGDWMDAIKASKA